MTANSKPADPSPRIGKPGAPVRVLAFSGGAYGTIPQLGTAHALLASDARPPDLVVGVSVGAVNAVALAEILQAGNGAPPSAALSAKIAKLLEVVDAYASAQRDLLQAVVPDIYQVDAQRPLTAPELPLQAREERTQRESAIAAKAGLIRFVNDLLSLGLTVGALARGVRLYLGWRAAAEAPLALRLQEYAVTLWRAWWLFGRNLAHIAPALVTLTLHVLETFLPDRLRKGLGLNQGKTAAGLIFSAQSRVRRGFWSTSHLTGLAALVVLWLCPVALGAWALASLWLWAGTGTALLGAPLAVLRDGAAVALWGGLAVLGAALVGGLLASRGEGLSHRIFRYYEIANGWFDPHPLRERLIQLFDPDYYGAVSIDRVVSSVLEQGGPPERGPSAPKSLGSYATGAHPIHVGLVGARVEDGRLEVLRGATPVIDALMVATALPPFFEAQAIAGQWYVDGALIVQEPTRALIPYLKRAIDPAAAAVHIYSVVPLPLGQAELGGKPDHAYTRLTEIAIRSLQLQRFRDATLDRRMTHLYSRALDPAGPAAQKIGSQTFVRAWVYPLEPDDASELSGKLFLARPDDRRGMILDAVADGCRSALEGMLPDSIAAVAKGAKTASCREVLSAYTAKRLPLAQTAGSPGPGLRQVCERCAVSRAAPAASPERGDQCLRLRDERREWPPWPHRADPSPGQAGRAIVLPAGAYDKGIRESLDARAKAQEYQAADGRELIRPWPAMRGGLALEARPVVSLLFAGGVFRGVYLMGVVNALNEIGLRPDLIAGSSVGTITAAMTASVFCRPSMDERRTAVVRLVSAFLALDRLVLTDRFAEFVRGLTVRAAAADFSLRHLDHLFRAFDRADSGDFSHEARRALAGLERLFYTSPFDVAELTQALRKGENGRALELLSGFAQDFLERGGVGLEVLGAAPLAALIEHYVVRPQLGAGAALGGVPLDLFASRDIVFVATATNLTRGRLEHLGGDELKRPARRAVLVESLLASSAFPAVFRPRWAYEAMPLSGERDQFVDGGLMDNLPLDAVAHFLSSAASAKLIAHRPKLGGKGVPHLMFTASLEVDPERLRPREASRRAESWLEVYRRARELGYNSKLDAYRRMQRDLRTIRESRKVPVAGPDFEDLLDLEVVEVKPAWLCGTFAFHPMLGFRRAAQAASIAHGCASTLDRFQEVRADASAAEWIGPWGIELDALDGGNARGAPRTGAKADLGPEDHGPDLCFFRKDVKCPFSPGELRRLAAQPDSPLTDAIVEAVAKVYAACGKRETHRATE